MTMLMVLLALTAGLCLAVQGPINSALGRRTSVFRATAVSFLGGVLVLAIAVALFGSGDLSRLSQAAPWQLIGGFYGMCGVVATVTALPVLGAALTTAVMLLGQLMMSCVIDGLGLMGVTPATITPLRLQGLLTVACGIVLIYLGGSEKKGRRIGGRQLLLIPMVFAAGALGALQSPTNASLSGIVGGLEGALVSFTGGFLCIAIILLIATRGRLAPFRGVGIRPWMACGGLFGAAVIFMNIFSVQTLGSALQAACIMTGQFGGGLIVDSLGLLGVQRRRIDRLRQTGVGIIALGVVLVTLGRL